MNIMEEMQRSKVQGLSAFYFNGEQERAENYGVLKKGFTEQVDESTLFHACSISKLISAICVLNLVAEGVLSLTQDVNIYLRGWKLTYQGIPYIPVTLSMLLSHYSGIVDYPDSFEPYGNIEDSVSNLALLSGKTRFHASPICVTVSPGSQFEYSDAGYCVIRQILEDVTGTTIDELADKYIFSPLLLSNPFFWHREKEKNYPLEICSAGHNASGEIVEGVRACYPNPEGAGLWITTADLACIVKDLIQCFNGNGHILPKEQTQIMMTPHFSGSFSGLGVFLVPDKSSFFSQGWGIGMQCKLVANLERNEGIIVMMNCEPGVDQDHSIIGRIIEDVLS